jgi:hypothetical protein
MFFLKIFERLFTMSIAYLGLAVKVLRLEGAGANMI